MKNLWVICLSVCVLSCATPADNWDIKVPDSAVPEVIELPAFPDPIESNNDMAVYSKDAVKEMVLYTIAAKANTGAGAELAEEVKDLRRGAEKLVEMGKIQENISNMKGEALTDERRHNFFTTIVYWAAILGLVVL